MKLHLGQLALAASLTLAFGANASADQKPLTNTNVPVQHLIDAANALLAQGDMHGALDNFDAAIKKDPSNYLTIFKRGATYLSLGRPSQATADFDKVLQIKPDFEAALVQRARIRAKAGEWELARKDFEDGGEAYRESVAEIDEAEQAAKEAAKAEKRKAWEECVENAGTAIRIAPLNAELRALRARCRLAKGEVFEGIGDLTHLVSLNPSETEAHIKIASLFFYSLGETDRARAQLKACLTFDQDNKLCKKHLRRIRTLDKSIEKAKQLREKRQYNSAIKILLGDGGESGVLDDVQNDMKELRKEGWVGDNVEEGLRVQILEMICDSYVELKIYDRGAPHCETLLSLSPHSIPAVLNKAHRLIKQDLFDEALILIESAREHNPNNPALNALSNEVQILLRRSKQKDYYKVLGVHRSASPEEIKKAYRKRAKEWHPDRYRGDLSKDEVEKKYSTLTEAYEVLGNEELRERFDRGDDPNDHSQQSHPFGGGFGGHHGGGQQQFFFRQQGQQGGFPFGGNGGGFKFGGF
ncbi:hypothetical protein DFH27DRAFT_143154 [Peziza echinospora]|nr:hypothetical protein DFH27DRAFT_143154 [Peziza echinospora]